MVEVIRINNGSFHAEIILDRLPEWRVSKLRKLFRLICLEPWENEATLDALNNELPKRILLARNAHEAAQQKFKLEYQTGIPKDIEARKKNRALSRAVSTSKTQLDRWIKIKSIYEGEYNL